MKGRKLHALVDTEGFPLRVIVHSAAIQDRDGAALVLDKIRGSFPWLELVWADGIYNAHQVDAAVAKVPVLRIEIVKRTDDMKGFVVLPRRWVIERTFSWFGRNRRLAKDFENLAETLLTFVSGHFRSTVRNVDADHKGPLGAEAPEIGATPVGSAARDREDKDATTQFSNGRRGRHGAQSGARASSSTGRAKSRREGRRRQGYGRGS